MSDLDAKREAKGEVKCEGCGCWTATYTETLDECPLCPSCGKDVPFATPQEIAEWHGDIPALRLEPAPQAPPVSDQQTITLADVAYWTEYAENAQERELAERLAATYHAHAALKAENERLKAEIAEATKKNGEMASHCMELVDRCERAEADNAKLRELLAASDKDFNALAAKLDAAIQGGSDG